MTFYHNGKIKSASETKGKKSSGEWIFFSRNGDEKCSGAYNSEGKKEGQWWYKKREIIWYNNGRIIKKGSGCKECKEF